MIQVIRASKLARPMTCAGSLFFTDIVEETNEAAKAGTAFGEYLRSLLDGTAVGAVASNGVYIDDDMKFYAQYLSEQVLQNAQTKIKCEHEVDWTTRVGVRISGHPDAEYFGKDGRLYIDDAKYGWGIVEVKENWQLLAYAIGAILKLEQPVDVVIRIMQPRPHHEDGPIRKWELSFKQVLEYKERIEKRMEEIVSGDSRLVTSSQCKYCPAAASKCPAISKAMYRGIEVAQEFVQDDLSNSELSHQLDLINRIAEIVKIKQDSLKSLAINRIREGKVVPNYMTVQSYGYRAWKPEFTPDTIEVITGKTVVVKELISPAKAEKMGIRKEHMDLMTTRPDLGQKLERKDSGEAADKVFGASAPVKLISNN
jgi:hypothetical protein